MSEENKFSFENKEYRQTYWHTCSHVLAQAMKRLHPDVKLAIGPSIDNGFYYDFDTPVPFTPEDLTALEAEMRKICKEKLKLERFELPRAEAIKFMEDKQRLLREACAGLKCTEKDILKKISSQNAELKEKDKEIAELKSKLTSGAEDDILNSAKDINGVKTVAYALEDVDGNALRDLADKIRNKMGSGVVVLVSKMNDKVNLVAMSTKDVLDKGVHCGKIIKEVAAVVGGGGGGRPDMAQAGGKNPEKINEAVENAYEIIEKLVK